MKRFVLLVLLALLPVLLVVAFYIVKDPFRVVKPYHGQIYNPDDTISLTINWGHVTVESFKYYDPQQHFDSFIFGSSLSGYYRIKDWQRHLPVEARPFHFNATRETIRGISNKLHWLIGRGVRIKHALLILENDMLQRRPLDDDVLFVQHPQTADNVSWWQFHQMFFNTYRHPEIIAYLIAPAPMTERVLGKGYATTDITTRIEPINEGYYKWADSIIAVNPEAFYTPEHLAKHAQPMRQMPLPDKITAPVESLLKDIASALKGQGTDYQIIIPPHYAWEAISSNDLYTLEQIFGMDRVHDYSHDAKMASNLHYYYDDGHLIAQECAHLMDSAYHAATLPSPYLKKQ